MKSAEQNAALKAKNRELHAEVERLTQELADVRKGLPPQKLSEFVRKIAGTQSKFAKEARELLD